MISYLILSTLSMSVLLLFYHTLLEKEKMHRINRAYLLFSLVFSFLIPVIPVGLAESYVPWFQRFLSAEEIQPGRLLTPATGSNASATGSNGDVVATGPGEEASSPGWITKLVFVVYLAIAFLLLVRLLRNIILIRMKILRNPCHLFEGHKIVLLAEQVVPHTFMNAIFVNRKQYQKGEIGREVLLHELTHARQKHTLDILFVELLKVIFWFNPLLYFYKKAMQLNHEFLADEAVIADGTGVPEYQSLLLNTIMAQPTKGLTSNFNYSMTKKRFIMMTQSTSRLRTFIKVTTLLPLFAAMGMLLGCEPASPEMNVPGEKIMIEISASETIVVDGQKMRISGLADYLSRIREGAQTEFRLNIHPDAPVGVVFDVRKLIYLYNRSGNPHPNVKFVKRAISKSIRLEIDEFGSIRLMGMEVALEELTQRLAEASTDRYLTISFYVDNNASTDLIRTIEQVIRDSGLMRVNYHTVSGDG